MAFDACIFSNMLLLQSPDGTQFRVTVTDNGRLRADPVDDLPDDDRHKYVKGVFKKNT
jgi:hypothetical protein